MKNNPEYKALSVQDIKPVLNKVAETIENKLKRETFFADEDLQITLYLQYKMALTNFRGVIYLCKSHKKGIDNLFLNCPALNRSLFDALFQSILLLDNPPKFRERISKTALREAKEIHQFRENEYGENQSTKDKILDFETNIENLWKLTEEQKEDRKKLPKHTSTGQIPGEFISQKKPIASLLNYLYEAYYLNLSQFSHSQATGLLRMNKLINDPIENEILEFIDNEIWTATNLFLCLISEIEINLNVGLKQDILTLWTFYIIGNPTTKKIYEMRYKEFFSNQASLV